MCILIKLFFGLLFLRKITERSWKILGTGVIRLQNRQKQQKQYYSSNERNETNNDYGKNHEEKEDSYEIVEDDYGYWNRTNFQGPQKNIIVLIRTEILTNLVETNLTE